MPALAHDSVTSKNIDDAVIVNIYKAYSSFHDKQIFTVIDKVTSNKNQDLKTIVDDNRFYICLQMVMSYLEDHGQKSKL